MVFPVCLRPSTPGKILRKFCCYQATVEFLVIDCFENSGKFRIRSFLKEMEPAISFTKKINKIVDKIRNYLPKKKINCLWWWSWNCKIFFSCTGDTSFVNYDLVRVHEHTWVAAHLEFQDAPFLIQFIMPSRGSHYVSSSRQRVFWVINLTHPIQCTVHSTHWVMIAHWITRKIQRRERRVDLKENAWL